jgi:hypothetical protein
VPITIEVYDGIKTNPAQAPPIHNQCRTPLRTPRTRVPSRGDAFHHITHHRAKRDGPSLQTTQSSALHSSFMAQALRALLGERVVIDGARGSA